MLLRSRVETLYGEWQQIRRTTLMNEGEYAEQDARLNDSDRSD
jgi:hypothetical protein